MLRCPNLLPRLGSTCKRAALLRVRALSSSSDLLIEDSKFSWLKELGLKAENPGVFDGSWHANGQVSAIYMVLYKSWDFYYTKLCKRWYEGGVFLNFILIFFQVVTSYSPASGRPIARVQEVSIVHVQILYFMHGTFCKNILVFCSIWCVCMPLLCVVCKVVLSCVIGHNRGVQPSCCQGTRSMEVMERSELDDMIFK